MRGKEDKARGIPIKKPQSIFASDLPSTSIMKKLNRVKAFKRVNFEEIKIHKMVTDHFKQYQLLKNFGKRLLKMDLSYHNSLQYHKTSLLKAEMFLNIFVKNVPSIIDTLDNDRTEQIKLNRLKLTPIIECIILCGRQELALCGHRNTGSINFNDASNSNDSNEGNFRAILKYKAKDLDYLKEHFESDSRNKYISPRIQNEIITICGDIILHKLIKMVNESECFSVLADETSDVSNKEQLALCVRYINGTEQNAKL
ncbi:uncharacterized protein LOC112604102 [Melanaphis sacchari]|uniref:Zinc finger MYM-type protein 1 n=1 Tax=Melanaphis sacchari TaxID=742174 RepID=A0A2H8TMP5_9HEMI|nr:uncharacterized protein LOC112604102 [Melanaphis sacchari]